MASSKIPPSEVRKTLAEAQRKARLRLKESKRQATERSNGPTKGDKKPS